MKTKWLWVLVLAWLTGCVPAIAPSLQKQATAVDFAALSAHPEQFKGRLVILGGEVMSLKPWGKDGTLMTVSQQAMSQLGNPRGAPSGGTFVVESDKWLSPGTYQPRSTVKVAGMVEGRRDGFLLLKAKEVVFNAPPVWKKWFFPVPPEWYGNDPSLEYWYTPPYWNPWFPDSSR